MSPVHAGPLRLKAQGENPQRPRARSATLFGLLQVPQWTAEGAQGSDAGQAGHFEAGMQASLSHAAYYPYEAAVQQQQEEQQQQDEQQQQHEVQKQIARAARLQGASSGRCVTCFGKCGHLAPEHSHCECAPLSRAELRLPTLQRKHRGLHRSPAPHCCACTSIDGYGMCHAP